MTEDNEHDQEILYYFEQVQLALGRTAAALNEARETVETYVPFSFSETLLPWLKDIEGLAQSVLPRNIEAPVMPQPYRNGLICSIDGIGYWHTGCKYWIAIGSHDGPQEDLRELPGFDRVAKRFQQYSSLLHGREWQEAGEADSNVASAIALLRVRNERLWWDAVISFLRAYKGQRVDRELARRTLLDCGFEPEKVARLLPE